MGKPDFSLIRINRPSVGSKCQQVKPWPTGVPLDHGRIAQGSTGLFDLWATEFNNMGGVFAELYKLDVGHSVNDALYGEPTEDTDWKLYPIRVYVQKPESTPLVSELGKRLNLSSRAWVSRKAIEDLHIREPNEGDVLRFYDTPYFNHELAVDGVEGVPDAGLYFDITGVSEDGYTFEGPIFVGFQLELKRRTEFTAERRILAP